MKLLNEDELLDSSIVANCRMNRERRLSGDNSYSRDLRFDIAAWFSECHASQSGKTFRWIDLCCGSGIALHEAEATCSKISIPVEIWGLDLVGHFSRPDRESSVKLQKTSVEAWNPDGKFDLVTCVHGLHYVGDKLSAILKMIGCLADHGCMRANIDLANFRFQDGKPAGRTVARRLRAAGIEYDSRNRLLHCTRESSAPPVADLRLKYLGADDQSGPNSTGQPAVDSYYEAV